MNLRPCPFCGSRKVAVKFYNQPSVTCENCGSFGPAGIRLAMHNMEECKQKAEELWNKRTQPEWLSQALNEGDGTYKP